MLLLAVIALAVVHVAAEETCSSEQEMLNDAQASGNQTAIEVIAERHEYTYFQLLSGWPVIAAGAGVRARCSSQSWPSRDTLQGSGDA